MKDALLSIIIFVILPLIPIIVNSIRRFKKDLRIIRSRDLYPYVYANSLEAKKILNDGLIESKDVASLLLCLANKGYIEILEENGDSEGKKRYKIIQVKKYAGNKNTEKQFLECLFPKNMKMPVWLKRKEIYLDEIDDDFCQRIYDRMNKTPEKKFSLSSMSTSEQAFICYFLIITFIFLIAIPNFFKVLFGPEAFSKQNVYLRTLDSTFAIVSFLGIASLVSLAIYALPIMNKEDGGIPVYFVFLFLWGVVVFFGFGLTYGAHHEVEDTIYYIIVVGIFSTIVFIIEKAFWIITLLSSHMLNGNKDKINLNNFLAFIKKASRQELAELSIEDEEYFYNVLPYAYSFDFLDELVDKFEVAKFNAPSWYLCKGRFDFQKFMSFMNYVMSSLEKR